MTEFVGDFIFNTSFLAQKDLSLDFKKGRNFDQ